MENAVDLDARFWLVAISIIGAVVAISRWTGRVDTRLEKLESFMESVKKDMEKFRKQLAKVLRAVEQEVAGASPLKLTELGTKMAEFMKAQDWAGSLAPSLLPQVVNKQPFEVDLFAQEHVATKLDSEMARRVAACAYEFGRDQSGVRNVLHVVLRDELLERLQGESPATS